VLYRLDGGERAPESTLELSGYRGSGPVRVGNGADDQEQLDIYGDLMQTAWLCAEAAGGLDSDTGRRLAQIADLVCELWRRPDSGIWEVRSEPLHFTHSKMMCWVALHRASRRWSARSAPQPSVPSRAGRRCQSPHPPDPAAAHTSIGTGNATVRSRPSRPIGDADMAKDHGPSVKDDKQYEGLRKKGMSKQRAAAIANDPNSSSKGGKRSGSGQSSSRSRKSSGSGSGGNRAQKQAAGRKGGKKSNS
jgi:glycosyl hydrolase family 15